jgi:hypothetical protein
MEVVGAIHELPLRILPNSAAQMGVLQKPDRRHEDGTKRAHIRSNHIRNTLAKIDLHCG